MGNTIGIEEETSLILIKRTMSNNGRRERDGVGEVNVLVVFMYAKC
jgi:hypothetical protein